MKNKQFFKAMYVLITLLLVCPSIVCAKTKTTRSAPGTAIFVMSEVKNPITVESRHFKYSDESIKLNMEIPKISWYRNNGFQKEFNKATKKSAQNRKNEMIKLAKMYNKDLKKDGLPLIAFEYMEDFSVIDTIFPYYTLAFFKYEYNGGAHGISEVNYLTFDLNTRQTIELKDLFNNKIDYKSVLDYFVREQLANAEDRNVFFPSEGTCLIKENQPFFFDVNGDLNIVYNPYEIAPYSCGIICIKLPFENLLPYMK